MKISIVTTTYNTAPEYIKTLWASLEAQTSADWQWIVHDDGSDKLDLKSLWADIAQDERVHYSWGVNQGVGAAMLQVMSHPNMTDWTLRVDADDWLEPDAVSSSISAIEANPDAALIYADHWCHRYDRVDDGIQRPEAEIVKNLLMGYNLFHMILMNVSAYKKTAGYDPEYRYASDYDIWLKLQEVGRFHHLPRQLYHWRENPQQMYHNFHDQQIFRWYLASKAACLRRDNKLKPILGWSLNPT